MDNRIETWLKLQPQEIEKTFVQVAIDLKEILVLDGIDQPSDPPGFRIRSHDLYGQLPEILVQDTGDRLAVLDTIQNETVKLIAIVKNRQDLAVIFSDCEFLLPTKTDEGYVVGIRFGGNTVLAEEQSNWAAYRKLLRKAVERA